MAYDSIHLYRKGYAALLRLHPRKHYERFGEGMEQTFNDLLREGAGEGRGLFVFALWMFVETSAGIIREHITSMLTQRTSLFVAGMLCLLLVPFFAMLFQVEGWDWKVGDFAIMSVILVLAGIGLATATCSALPLRKRVIGIAVVGLLFLFYVHIAVGIVDTWPLAGS